MVLATLSNLLSRAKEQLKPVLANVQRILAPVTQFTRANPLTSGLALGVPAGVGLSAAVGAVRRRRKKKSVSKKRKRKSVTRKRKGAKRKSGKKKKWYGETRGRKIKHTKKGQPYVILKSGKAKFIKKSRARSMKKRKGGYS